MSADLPLWILLGSGSVSVLVLVALASPSLSPGWWRRLIWPWICTEIRRCCPTCRQPLHYLDSMCEVCHPYRKSVRR